MKKKLLLMLVCCTLSLAACTQADRPSDMPSLDTDGPSDQVEAGAAKDFETAEEEEAEAEKTEEVEETEETEETEVATLSEQTLDALENLYSIQGNYANGMAPLIEIPSVWTKDLYDNWDAIEVAQVDNAPMLLREYALTDMVYFDYDTDYSVVWDKKNDSVMVEPTDTQERDEFMQKEHKL